jgi:hypothetical protein
VWRGKGGTGRFPRKPSSAPRAEANLVKEGGPWGKPGFPHGSEPEGERHRDIVEVVREIADRTEAAAAPAAAPIQ